MRAKEGKGGRGRGKGEPIPSSLREISTWRFREQKHLRARRKRLTAGYVKQSREKLNTPNNARRNALQLTHRLQINYTRYFDGIVVIPLLLY